MVKTAIPFHQFDSFSCQKQQLNYKHLQRVWSFLLASPLSPDAPILRVLLPMPRKSAPAMVAGLNLLMSCALSVLWLL